MAKSTYGITPWGAWFLRMLEAYDGTGRISRGKSYANTGKVDSLVVKENKVGARVEGHYEPWYYISLTFPQISETNRKKLEKILASDPAGCIALANGIMTEQFIAACEKKDVRFIPRRWTLIKSDCSCPDSANPCKHIAAVLYILSKEIDHDPRLLFQLAGVNLAALCDITAANKEVPAFPDQKESSATEMHGIDQEAVAGPDTGAGFTAIGAAGFRYEHPVPLSLRHTDESAPEMPVRNVQFPLEESFFPLIKAMLPPFTSFYNGDLVGAFKELYHRLIVRQTKEFDFTVEQRIHTLMKTAVKAEAAALCGSARLLYTPVRVDTADFPNRNERNPVFPLRKKPNVFLYFKCANGTDAPLTLVQTLHLMHGVTPAADSPAGIKAVFAVLTLGERLISESALIPAVFLDTKTNMLTIFWKPLTSAQAVSAAIDRCALFITQDFFPQVKRWGRRYCTELLLTAFLTEYVHGTDFMPAGIRSTEKETAALFFLGKAIDTHMPGAHRLPEAIAHWLAALSYSGGNFGFRLILEQSKQSDFNISAEIRQSEDAGNRFKPLSGAGRSAQMGNKIIAFFLALSAYLPKLTELIEQKSVPLTREETAVFLKTAAPLLSRFGIEVVLPKTLQRALKPQAVFQLKKQKGAGAVQSYLTMENLMQYDRSIMLADTVISVQEFRKLMRHSSGLIKFNDRYILVDPEHTARLLEALQHEKPSVNDVLQGALTGNTVMEDGSPFSYSLFRETDAAVPDALQATLRPYQKKGFQWLYSTIKSGFGCLLGDDMGLGKTVQVIAFILKLKEQGFTHNGVLIVAPASLLPNWEHEIQKFAPCLCCTVLHGRGRRFASKSDIHITTYQTLRRDAAKISDKIFDCLIIDEAQAVKNTQTKNAQALRRLQAHARIAMTGTPVENSLEDMRALFDFIIPGYLGSAEAFRKKWRIPIELHGDAESAEAFQKITAPFLLRRLKTDPAVISDLPEKVITPQYCRLTPEQTALYESLIQTQLKSIIKAEDGLKRSALVLKLLTALKQTCNHPHLYDTNFPPALALSGKTVALMQLLEEILDAGEKVLIFSQYAQTLFLLQQLMREQLDTEPAMLHGRMPLSVRKTAVEAFQTDPARRIFLISLKAGGTGLNLTAASRVIHFDLWYNPATEDQATDRAFRIGQHRTVFVSRFICAGTFEEKIDEMIQKKRHISQMTLSSGESWIGKMSNEELAELFG